MRKFFACIALASILTLIGCGDRDREVKPVEETVFGDMVDNKRRAQEGVDKAMEANKQKLDEAMKKQEAAEQ
jgi:response regulator of citrate/malate metabolism